MEDPRSVFRLPEDSQLIVYFEWEGPKGLRRFEGHWKDPSGKVVLIAPTDYEVVRRRFGIFWSLALPPTAAAGLWALEIRVEGQVVGSHTFEVSGGQLAALPMDSLYKCASAGMTRLERLGADGELLGWGVATALDQDLVVTSFASIEGAASVQLQLSSRTAPSDAVAAWDRHEGWAVLRVPGHGLSAFPAPPQGVVPIGRCVFTLSMLADGGQVIGQAQVAGRRDVSSGRSLLRLSDTFAGGSPVLDGQCRLLGVVVADSVPSWPGPPLDGLHHQAGPVDGAAVVPYELLLPARGASPVTLADMMNQGIFMRPLSAERRLVVSGVFAARLARVNAVMWPVDQAWAFSRSTGSVVAYVQWDSTQQRDAMTSFEVFDLENQVVGRSGSAELKLRPGRPMYSSWTFSIQTLPPGTYRVDLLLDGSPVWRAYLEITA
jgi:hypothetical protein